MKTQLKQTLMAAAILTLPVSAFAGTITQAATPSWQSPLPYTSSATDCDESGDAPECLITGSLGFSVTLGSSSYTEFYLDPNGYVELYSATGSASEYGYGAAADLVDGETNAFIMAAYDDLVSYTFGVSLLSDRAIFHWDTETYWDNAPLGEMEVVLYNNGDIDWNFQGFQVYNVNGDPLLDYISSADTIDLYTGLYINGTGAPGITGDLMPAIQGDVPFGPTSYQYVSSVPVPAAVWLFASGMLGLIGVSRRRA